MAKNITPVPNGPLIKKKGPFKGSTLKSGGTIKKAQNGDTLTVKKPMTYAEKRAAQEIVKQKNREARENVLNRNAAAQDLTREQVRTRQESDKNKEDAVNGNLKDGSKRTKKTGSCVNGSTGGGQSTDDNKRNGGPIKKAKGGARMSGMKKKLTSAKIAKDPQSRINKSLRK